MGTISLIVNYRSVFDGELRGKGTEKRGDSVYICSCSLVTFDAGHTTQSPTHCNSQLTMELTKSFVCMSVCACARVHVGSMCCRYLPLNSGVAHAGFHDKGNGGRCDRPGRGCVLRPWVFLRDSGAADAHRKDEPAGHLDTHERDQLLFKAHKNEGQLDAGTWELSGTAAHLPLNNV